MSYVCVRSRYTPFHYQCQVPDIAAVGIFQPLRINFNISIKGADWTITANEASYARDVA